MNTSTLTIKADPAAVSSIRFCQKCGRLLTLEETAKYNGPAYCNECTWEMWADTETRRLPEFLPSLPAPFLQRQDTPGQRFLFLEVGIS